MINLLPQSEIVCNLTEYRRRRLVMTGALFLAVIIILIILTASLLAVIKFRQSSVNNLILATKRHLQEDDARQLTAVFDLVKRELQRLGKKLNVEPRLISVLAALDKNKIPGVRITSIGYDRLDLQPVVLKLNGTASSRGGLLSFVDTLRKNPFFETVESPVTNLIKEQNVDFSLSLVIKKEK